MLRSSTLVLAYLLDKKSATVTLCLTSTRVDTVMKHMLTCD